MSTNELPSTQKVVLFEENSDSLDVIKFTDFDTPKIASPNEIIIKNKFAGVNFIDSYFRKGVYPSQKPHIFGREAVGVVAAVGDKVTKFSVGDKVAYLSGSTFAQYTKLTDSHVQILKLDPSTSDESLKFYAAALLQGLTALTFIHESYEVQEGDYILVWAAAGGVGKVLTQLISQKGAHVIAIASTEEKLALAKKYGAEYGVNHLTDDIVEKVKEITDGKGVNASFDSVGKDSAEITLTSLARKGTFVSYGNSSGVVPPLSINRLSPKNLTVLRPQLMGYVTTSEEWEHYVRLLFKLIDSGDLKIDILKTYPLSEYKQATADLEGRKTTGKLVLEVPQ